MSLALKILAEETPKEFFKRRAPSEEDLNFFGHSSVPEGVSPVLFEFAAQINDRFPVARTYLAGLVSQVNGTRDNYEAERLLVLADAAMREMPAAVLRQNGHGEVADMLLEAPPISAGMDIQRMIPKIATARALIADTDAVEATVSWRVLGVATDVAAWVLSGDEEYAARLSVQIYYLAKDWRAAIETLKKMVAVK